jgi:hypothetical protein
MNFIPDTRRAHLIRYLRFIAYDCVGSWTVLGVYSVLNDKLIVDLSVDSMNPGVTPIWDVVKCYDIVRMNK